MIWYRTATVLVHSTLYYVRGTQYYVRVRGTYIRTKDLVRVYTCTYVLVLCNREAQSVISPGTHAEKEARTSYDTRTMQENSEQQP